MESLVVNRESLEHEERQLDHWLQSHSDLHLPLVRCCPGVPSAPQVPLASVGLPLVWPDQILVMGQNLAPGGHSQHRYPTIPLDRAES